MWANDKPGRRSLSLTAEGVPLPGRDDLYPDEDSELPVTERLVTLTREASRLALPLAAEFDMVRVDFLVTAERLYAGELTIYSSGGYDIWHNPDIPAGIAEAWDLRDSWFMQQPHTGLVGRYCEALRAAEAARIASLTNKPASMAR